MTFSSRRSIFGFLKAFMSLPTSRSITARTLVKLFLTSPRQNRSSSLLPVLLH